MDSNRAVQGSAEELWRCPSMDRVSRRKQAAAEAAEQEAARAAGSAAEAQLRLSEPEQQLPQQQRRTARPEVARAAVTSGLLLLTTLLLSQGAQVQRALHLRFQKLCVAASGRIDSRCKGIDMWGLAVPQSASARMHHHCRHLSSTAGSRHTCSCDSSRPAQPVCSSTGA